MISKKFILFFLIIFVLCCFTLSSNIDPKILKKAADIHSAVHTVDTHTDTPLRFFGSDLDISKKNESGCVDLPPIKNGKLNSIFFAIFLGQGKRTPKAYQRVQKRTMEIFEYIKHIPKKYPQIAGLALSPKDAYQLEKEGKRAIFIGIENGYPIGKNLSLVKEYYDLGARYITLCHSKNNDICDSSTDKPEHQGLSEFGKKVVLEMNRLGMIIDVSHISDQAFFDVIDLTNAPIIASHSNVRSLCNHPRNLNDEMLKALAENNGVIQLSFVSSFVKKIPQSPEREIAFKALRIKYKNYETLSEQEKEKVREEWYEIDIKYPPNYASVKDLVDHVDYINKLIGINHVGFGSDFDGGGGLLDCKNVSQIGNITIELVKRGYSKEDIRKIWGGNFMRVFNQIIKTSEKL